MGQWPPRISHAYCSLGRRLRLRVLPARPRIIHIFVLLTHLIQHDQRFARGAAGPELIVEQRPLRRANSRHRRRLCPRRLLRALSSSCSFRRQLTAAIGQTCPPLLVVPPPAEAQRPRRGRRGGRGCGWWAGIRPVAQLEREGPARQQLAARHEQHADHGRGYPLRRQPRRQVRRERHVPAPRRGGYGWRCGGRSGHGRRREERRGLASSSG